MPYRIIFDNTLQQGSPLSETQAELLELRGQLDSTLRELEEMKRKLQEKEAEAMKTECVLQKGSITKWDVFYSCKYYNKVLTRKRHKKLRASWNSLIGVNMTDQAIEAIKQLHEEETCE